LGSPPLQWWRCSPSKAQQASDLHVVRKAGEPFSRGGHGRPRHRRSRLLRSAGPPRLPRASTRARRHRTPRRWERHPRRRQRLASAQRRWCCRLGRHPTPSLGDPPRAPSKTSRSCSPTVSASARRRSCRSSGSCPAPRRCDYRRHRQIRRRRLTRRRAVRHRSRLCDDAAEPRRHDPCPGEARRWCRKGCRAPGRWAILEQGLRRVGRRRSEQPVSIFST